MDSASVPPVYSASDTAKGNEELPAFEPGASSPPFLVDSKPPLEKANDEELAPHPRRARAPSGSVPANLAPPSLLIGTRTVGPFDLVTIPEIRAHLTFLGAFARLKAQVKSQKGPDVRGSVDELWATYIARAVDRFAKWADKVIYHQTGPDLRELTEVDVPPLDVLMAWHTYMLNPRVYFEDGVRKKSKLWKISSFPLNLADKIIDLDTLVALHPSADRQHRFESLTGQPWAAPLNTTYSDTTFIPCPRCEDKTPTEVCWVTSENTGFAQHDFKARCHACMGVFDRNAMMVRSLCDDIIKVRIGLESGKELDTYIAGTILNWQTGLTEPSTATKNNRILLKHFLSPSMMKFTRGDWLAGSFDYSVKQVEESLKAGLSSSAGIQQVTRILSYYRAPNYPFSIELCGAILRQGSFIDKMVNMGWTEPHTFDDDPITLIRCISRYNAWLDVMSQLTQKMLVPTLDIDLAWHTHQLKYDAYRKDTLALIGQFVDHDDKIEENKLSEAYDKTAKYWEQRWGVPYHMCGCSRSLTRKFPNPVATLSKIFRGKGKAPAKFVNPSPQLISTHDCDSSDTHPSEHNSVLVVGQPVSESRRVKRTTQQAKWDKQTRSDLSKGKLPADGWEAINTQRSEGHDQAYVRPIPDPNLTPVVPYGAETCASHDGSALPKSSKDGNYGAGMCAIGMGPYGIAPIGGFYIGPMGNCGGSAMGGCGGGGGCGGSCGGGGCGGCGGCG